MRKLSRVVCPKCGKAFDPREEGFIYNGYLICAKCYHKISFAASAPEPYTNPYGRKYGKKYEGC